MKATKAPTRAKTSDAAVLDAMVGPSDGEAGYKRIDVQVRRRFGGSLQVEFEVPPRLAQSVAVLLAALGVKAGNGVL
jgi:hypothetical protein